MDKVIMAASALFGFTFSSCAEGGGVDADEGATAAAVGTYKMEIRVNGKTLTATMANNCHESADVPTVFFERYANYMRWENLGVIAAMNSWTVDDIKRTDYPRQAYELGKSLK